MSPIFGDFNKSEKLSEIKPLSVICFDLVILKFDLYVFASTEVNKPCLFTCTYTELHIHMHRAFFAGHRGNHIPKYVDESYTGCPSD